ncbi:MAG: STM4015 family protein [Planctomycetes bacterium]|nr:STM4015 family protein [Planctomycetota bacterium]
MTINQHAETFAGKPVKDYKPAVGLVAGPMKRREFQFTEGTSKKFWAIELEGTRHTVHFGRIGTAGQTQTKEFDNEDKARKSYEKLLAEKVNKGYVEVTAPTEAKEAEAKPAPSKSRKKASPEPELPVALRLDLSYEEAREGGRLTDRLAALLQDPAAGQVSALVIGNWSFEGENAAPIVEALVAARDKLTNLKSLFLGDIVMEEQEISWIQQTDMSPLFDAYPELEHLRIRGGTGLSLGTVKHKHLQSLILESGGLPVEVVRAVGSAKLPALEHLELWLGTPEYGGNATVEDLQPILAGKQFPKLHYLGLRDSEMADQVAAAVAQAPVLKKIRVLDLSLGNLSDEGAKALLASPAVAQLEKLDIHHHYVSKELVKQLKALGITVDAGDPEEPDEYDDEVHRYIAVSE